MSALIALRTLMRQRAYDAQVDQLRRASPIALDQGKTECCRSGVCCWRMPCEILHADIPRIAGALGMTEREFVRAYLVLDGPPDMLTPRMRRAHQQGGARLSPGDSWSLESPCVMLDLANGNACKLHGKAKPTVGEVAGCWKEETPETVAAHTEKWTAAECRDLGFDLDLFSMIDAAEED